MAVMFMCEASGGIVLWSLGKVALCRSKRVGRVIQPRKIRTVRVESVVLAEDRDKQLSLRCVRYGEHKQRLTGDGVA